MPKVSKKKVSGGLYLGKETVRKDKGIVNSSAGTRAKKKKGKKRLTQAAPKTFLRA